MEIDAGIMARGTDAIEQEISWPQTPEVGISQASQDSPVVAASRFK